MELGGIPAIVLACACVLELVSVASARHRIGEKSTLLQEFHTAEVAACRRRGNLYAWHAPLAKCMPLLEETPACLQPKEVLVLNYTTLEAQCMVLPCDVTHVLRPDGRCHTKEDFCSHAEDKELVLKESGYGTCDCPDLHVYWLPDDTCYEAYTQGPCADGEFIVYREGLGVICERNPCQRNQIEWRGRCVPRLGHGCLDSVHGHLVVNPANLQHECTLVCPDGMVELELDCHFLYMRGPCPEGQYVVQVPHTADGRCEPNPCREDGLLLWMGKCWHRGEYCSVDDAPINNELEGPGDRGKTPYKRQPLMLPQDDHFFILGADDIGDDSGDGEKCEDQPEGATTTAGRAQTAPAVSAPPAATGRRRPDSSPHFRPRPRLPQSPPVSPATAAPAQPAQYPSYGAKIRPLSSRPPALPSTESVPSTARPLKKMSPEHVLTLMAARVQQKDELPPYFAFLPPQPEEPDDLQGQICGTPFAQVAPPPGFLERLEATTQQPSRGASFQGAAEKLQLSMEPPARTAAAIQQSYTGTQLHQGEQQANQRRPPSDSFAGSNRQPRIHPSTSSQAVRRPGAAAAAASVPFLPNGYLPPAAGYQRRRRHAASYSPAQLRSLLEAADLEEPLQAAASSALETRVPAPAAGGGGAEGATAARLAELQRQHGFHAVDGGDHPFSGSFEATPQIHGLHINVNPLTNQVECSDAIGFYRTISFAHYKCRPGSRRDLLGECHHEGPEWTDYHPDRCPFGMRHNLLTGKCILVRR